MAARTVEPPLPTTLADSSLVPVKAFDGMRVLLNAVPFRDFGDVMS